VRAVPGAAAMWNLTVSQVHTYAVGAGEYVVHNCGSGNDTFIGQRMQRRVDDDLLNAPSKRGNAPTEAETGRAIEIHHLNQDPNGPFEEMTFGEHRGPATNLENHPIRDNSPVNHDTTWRREVRRYWAAEWDRGRWKS
jgi:hypothetical protein